MEYNKKFIGEYASENGRNLVPRSVIVIGKTPVYTLEYNLVTNTDFTTDSLNFSIPMELLDIRELIKNFLKQGSVVPIAVYSGFIDCNSKHFCTYDFDYLSNNTNNIVKSKLLEKYKEFMSLRWVGLMNQPELIFGDVNSPDMYKFTASDFSKILSKYKYENQFDGEKATVENVLKDINSKLSTFKFVVDARLPTAEFDKIAKYNIGFKVSFEGDEEKVETSQYSTAGKSYYQVLQDICEKTRTTIVPDIDGYDTEKLKINYILTTRKTSNIGWKLYRDKDFKSCTLRLGEFSSTPSPKIGVKMYSKKKDAEEYIIGSFPKNLSETSPEGQRVFNYNVSEGLDKSKLELLAEEKAQEIGKLELNGDLFIPNAIVGMKCKHQIKLENSKLYNAYRDLKIIGDVNFVVDSITEDYNQEGLSQKVEISLDLNTNTFLAGDGTVEALDVFDVNDSSKDVKFLPSNNKATIETDISNVPEYLKKFRKNGFI